MNTVSGATVTAGTTNVTQLLVTDKPRQSEFLTFFIVVTAGTIKIGRGGIDANSYGVTSADGKWIFECKHEELYFQAAANTDTFVVI